VIPVRVQRRRTKGWKTPPNTVYAGRPGEWGNRYVIGESFEHVDGATVTVRDAAHAVQLWEEWFAYQDRHFHVNRQAQSIIGGSNLSCWCALCPKHAAGKPFDVECADCAPCHTDPLGRIANSVVSP